MPQDTNVTIGRVNGVHGLHGNLKVASYAESDNLFNPGSDLIVKMPDGVVTTHRVTRASPYKKGFLIRFKGIDDINAAEMLKGAELLVPRECLPDIDPEVEKDTWYWIDLIGITVRTLDGEDLGTLKSIFRTGSNDVYVVSDGNEEILIPAIAHVISSVDIQAGLMTVDLPEGL